MNRSLNLLTILLWLLLPAIMLQAGELPRKGIIFGTIIDDISGDPVEYATVALYRGEEQTPSAGVITDLSGYFGFRGLEPATYHMEITFVGYDAKQLNDLIVDDNQWQIDLGDIRLMRSSLNLQEVEIVDGTPAVEYQIDRKVIHVDKQITALSGTAVDILASVPSVSVDLEGNVTLRGASGFTVLIDGKPSILDPTDILSQIPASSISDIEIITNPSAKYDPDGTAGIINIKMKKIRLEGLNGVFNGNLGQHGTMGTDFLLNYRKEKFNFYVGADYNVRSHPGGQESRSTTYSADTIFHTNASGDRERQRTNYNVRGGIEYNPTDLDYINLGATYGNHSHTSSSLLNYDEWTEPGFHNRYLSREESSRGGDYYTLNLDYRHQFGTPEHELALQAIWDGRDGDEESVNELTDSLQQVVSGQRSTEIGPMKRLRLKLDYTRPIHENNKLEAGYQFLYGRSTDENEVSFWDIASQEWILQPEYGHITHYRNDIHAVYATFSGEWKQLGYMVGLRGEYTNRRMELEGEQTSFVLDRMDYFPSLHLSYQFPDDHQLMLSYSRRIERPRGFFLEPFITIQDAYNVRQGNPNLLPEYIDSYDLGYQKKIDPHYFNLDAYYRVNHNKIERVSSVYSENIMLNTFENVGTDYSLGTELMVNLKLWKWWTMELMGNLYHYRIKGVLYDAPFERTSLNWGSRANNTFLLGDNTKLQINGNYESPTVSAQGTRQGFYMLNAAISREFFKHKLTLVAQARDLLQTARWEFTSSGPDFDQYRLFTREAPTFTLTATFKLNNYKVKKDKGGSSGTDGMVGGEGEY